MARRTVAILLGVLMVAAFALFLFVSLPPTPLPWFSDAMTPAPGESATVTMPLQRFDATIPAVGVAVAVIVYILVVRGVTADDDLGDSWRR
jgi:hypothetical protein